MLTTSGVEPRIFSTFIFSDLLFFLISLSNYGRYLLFAGMLILFVLDIRIEFDMIEISML